MHLGTWIIVESMNISRKVNDKKWKKWSVPLLKEMLNIYFLSPFSFWLDKRKFILHLMWAAHQIMSSYVNVALQYVVLC